MIVVEIHVFVRPDKGLSIMKETKEEKEESLATDQIQTHNIRIMGHSLYRRVTAAAKQETRLQRSSLVLIGILMVPI